jgi:hypothetical protein
MRVRTVAAGRSVLASASGNARSSGAASWTTVDRGVRLGLQCPSDVPRRPSRKLAGVRARFRRAATYVVPSRHGRTTTRCPPKLAPVMFLGRWWRPNLRRGSAWRRPSFDRFCGGRLGHPDAEVVKPAADRCYAVGELLLRSLYGQFLAMRQPAAFASASEQNQR